MVLILGKNYPFPIINYSESRKRALNTYTNFIIKIKFVANYAFFLIIILCLNSF